MTIDLAPFCHAYRAPLTAPFASGAYSYATDARIVVRVDRREGHEENPRLAANVDAFLAVEVVAMAAFPAVDLPPEPVYVPKPCKVCDATGRICATQTRCVAPRRASART